jgi:hexosaminidase
MEADYKIIPKPASLQMSNGRFLVDANTKISYGPGLENEAKFLSELLGTWDGKNVTIIPNDVNIEGSIELKLTDSIQYSEGYFLSVKHNRITVAGNSSKGVFYGIQTLSQLMPTSIEKKENNITALTIPNVQIEDSPRYGYRGMMLDVGRHFFPVDFIKRYIDLLAMHKMNRFHWHLTEDQGWRIEIKKYPQLTEVGAWRNGTIVGHFPGEKNDNKRSGGFYTQDEVKNIVKYASVRHITVIPEIEMPGHASAAIASYPYLSCFPKEATVVPENMMSQKSKELQKQGTIKLVQESWGIYKDVFCAGNDETFNFLEDVLDEVLPLFPSKFIHIGGDECPKDSWKRCPKCQDRINKLGLKDEHGLQSYFIHRIEKYIYSKGKSIIGWDEILEGGLAPNATVMSWRGEKGGIAAAKQSHNVIMTPTTYCYFDYYQSKDNREPLAIGGFLPVEKVYSYNPDSKELTSDEAGYITGGQANLWTEYMETPDKVEYMLLPRMTALSEVLWSPQNIRDWSDFRERFNQMAARYDALGIIYAKHILKEEKTSQK